MNRLSYILLTLIFCIFIGLGANTTDVNIGALTFFGILCTIAIGAIGWCKN